MAWTIMRTLILVLLARLSSCESSCAHHLPLVELEVTPKIPAGWVYHSEASATDVLDLRIAIKEPHTDYLRLADEVSNPHSPRYGDHLDSDELRVLLPNISLVAEAVVKWLNSQSVSKVSWDQDWLNLEVTVAQARTLLNASFALYKYSDNEPVLRALSYSVPESLLTMIDFIYPTIHFLGPAGCQSLSRPLITARQTDVPMPRTCPRTLQSRYNINYHPPDIASGSRLGIAGFLEQSPDKTDLQDFLSSYGLRNNSSLYTYDFEEVRQNLEINASRQASQEAMLDLEYAMAFTEPLHVTYFSTAGRPPTLSPPGSAPGNTSRNEPYLDFLQHVLSQEHPPQVISISYSDNERTVPPRYARKVCDLFAQLAIRGVTVIVASGDGGASGSSEVPCVDSEVQYTPTFPSSCPWVTSVGATAGYGEAADFSSGGFSDYFDRPFWQRAAVNGYLEQFNGSHSGYVNESGRGIPDISLQGNDYLVIAGGQIESVDGTSASAPLFAAMVTLLNDIRLRAGKPVLGFLNPLLYSRTAQGFCNDVTRGMSNGCQSGETFQDGWKALPGWDAVTGLGEPDFEAMRVAFT